ncbi:hypothetical protein HZH68_007953 [Vespula germanica]|uniref:Uncharacterized protein n=1 Tax=Vespula germanica TaxID=30212 RepID=A0A834K8L6_VESGE|nr:hypothetical protein HZH68_007953 [Vespula germanica]
MANVNAINELEVVLQEGAEEQRRRNCDDDDDDDDDDDGNDVDVDVDVDVDDDDGNGNGNSNNNNNIVNETSNDIARYIPQATCETSGIFHVTIGLVSVTGLATDFHFAPRTRQLAVKPTPFPQTSLYIRHDYDTNVLIQDQKF